MLIVATVKYIIAFVKIKPNLISWVDHPGGSIVEYDCCPWDYLPLMARPSGWILIIICKDLAAFPIKKKEKISKF